MPVTIRHTPSALQRSAGCAASRPGIGTDSPRPKGSIQGAASGSNMLTISTFTSRRAEVTGAGDD